MYFITTKRMLEVCFFQHTPTFIIEPKKRATKPDLHQSATRLMIIIFSFLVPLQPVIGQMAGT